VAGRFISVDTWTVAHGIDTGWSGLTGSTVLDIDRLSRRRGP